MACPVNQTTTLVFPEALKQLRSQSREAAVLGLSVVRTKPQGIVSVRPTAPGARGTIEFRGATRVMKVMLEATAEGPAGEVRVGAEAPPSAPSTAMPSASSPSAVTPTPSPTTTIAARPPLDLEGLLRAVPEEVDRREGLPGQRPMVLKDALYGDEWVWLRFSLLGGAGARVDRVWWEQGDITAYVQEAAGKDLRIVVQLPRAGISKKTRVSLKLASGPAYRFALTPSTLTSFFKGLFG